VITNLNRMIVTVVLGMTGAVGALAADLPGFVDVTRASGITFNHSIGDNELSNIVESTGAGCAFFDYDGDGDLDVYLVNGAYLSGISHARGRALAGKLSNALYRNDGKARFVDVTAEAGVGDRGYGMACVAGDIDNDGDADLMITNYGRDTLYRNNGDGTFVDATKTAGVGSELWSVGATFIDADNDGDLDLFVGGYLVFDPDYRYFYAAEAFPGPLAYRGQQDTMYRNRGDGTFEDVSVASGLRKTTGRAMGVAACDIDGDGLQDLFVANDGMQNFFYRNMGGGSFVNIALKTGTAFGQNGEATSAMGPEFGDFDHDGRMDLMVPDMGYGCLYRNTGSGFFEEMSARAGMATVLGQYTSWSGNFLDYDNDGVLDILIVNGDAHHLEPEEDVLFRGMGKGVFKDVSSTSGRDFGNKFVGRGSATGDFDNDGDLDLLVLDLNDRPRLLRNDGGNSKHWLMVRAVGTVSNRDAVGARITVTTGGRAVVGDVRSASGYLSQSDPRVHFGLGGATKADTVKIRWPSGHQQELKNVAANQVLTVREPERREKDNG